MSLRFRIEMSHHQQAWIPILWHSYTTRCYCLTLPSEFILFKYRYTSLHSLWAFTIHTCPPESSVSWTLFWFYIRLGDPAVRHGADYILSFFRCTYSIIQTDSRERATQVESLRLRERLLADGMGLGKTISALARMLIYTRGQLVEFELELDSKGNN